MPEVSSTGLFWGPAGGGGGGGQQLFEAGELTHRDADRLGVVDEGLVASRYSPANLGNSRGPNSGEASLQPRGRQCHYAESRADAIQERGQKSRAPTALVVEPETAGRGRGRKRLGDTIRDRFVETGVGRCTP